MIEEAYCSFETCKLLKEKGFPQDFWNDLDKYAIDPFPTWYTTEYFKNSAMGEWFEGKLYRIKNDDDESNFSYLAEKGIMIKAVSQQMAMQWLREVHHIHICPEYKAFFQEKTKKIYHYWCNKIIGIDRYYPSSKTCTCGYVNKELKLADRVWMCPHCGAKHNRDLLAANNILRQGIAELESVSKSKNAVGASSRSRLHPRISFLRG